MLRVVLPLLVVGCIARLDDTRQEEKDAAVISNRIPDHSGHGPLHNAICDGCQDLFTEVKDFINNPDAIEKLKTMLKKACPYFGGAEQDCINLIDDDLTSLIHQIQGYLDDPKKICSQMKLCTDGPMAMMYSKKFLIQYGKRVMTQLRTGSSALLCDECEFIAKEVKEIWERNATQVEIKSEILQGCSALGGLQEECEKLVNENWDNIVGIVNMLLADPKSICEQVGLCSTGRVLLTSRFYRHFNNYKSHARNVMHPSKVPRTMQLLRKIEQRFNMGSRAGCLACEFFMKWLEGFLMNDQTLQGIVSDVKQICPHLPSDVDKQCDDFLGLYGPAVLNMTVLTYLKPELVCEVMTACSSREASFSQNLATIGGNRMTCEACEATFAMIKMELKNRALQDELDGAIKSLVCDHINPEYKSDCNDVIDGYMPQVWLMLDDAMNAEQICKEIKAC